MDGNTASAKTSVDKKFDDIVLAEFSTDRKSRGSNWARRCSSVGSASFKGPSQVQLYN